jgi:hypothetical protein
MNPENYEAIDKALIWAEDQLEKLIFSGDHDTAKEVAIVLLSAKVALLDEVKR